MWLLYDRCYCIKKVIRNNRVWIEQRALQGVSLVRFFAVFVFVHMGMMEICMTFQSVEQTVLEYLACNKLILDGFWCE